MIGDNKSWNLDKVVSKMMEMKKAAEKKMQGMGKAWAAHTAKTQKLVDEGKIRLD